MYECTTGGTRAARLQMRGLFERRTTIYSEPVLYFEECYQYRECKDVVDYGRNVVVDN